MRAFEIHTFHGGRWRIDSIYDDRELAMFEAKRIDTSGRFTGVRVIEEIFDEDTRQTRTRTIFRGSKLERSNKENLQRSIESRRRNLAQQRRRAAEYQERRRQYLDRVRRRKSEPYRLILIFSLLVLFGIGTLILLQNLEQLL